jgi:hypothetical protein
LTLSLIVLTFRLAAPIRDGKRRLFRPAAGDIHCRPAAPSRNVKSMSQAVNLSPGSALNDAGAEIDQFVHGRNLP